MKATKKDKEAIVKEEERTAAESLNKEISNVGEESTENDNQITDQAYDDITPVEDLAWTIGGFLADRTAERFSEMVNGKEIALIKCIVHRLEHSRPKEAVKMIQMMFMVSGMEHAAEDLDILEYCHKQTDCSYDFFIDDLFQTDVFDWFLVDNWIDEGIERRKQDELLKEAVSWQGR